MKNIIKFFRKLVTSFNPALANRIMYRVKLKKKLNLRDPQTFNEKINWLKLYNYPYNELIILCTDKYEVRKYLEEYSLDSYLVNLIGVWDRVQDIDFNQLPDQFVLKCNHGCGYNILCLDKDGFDIKDAKRKLSKWISEDFGKVSGEPHYSKINRKIICEQFLAEDIFDYKFFCFKGEPKFFYVSQNVSGDFHNMQSDFFYIDGQPADFYRADHKRFKTVPVLPSNLNEMLELSKTLSKEFEFVRVDLYSVNSKIYFSELTFSPCSGFMPFVPAHFDDDFGKMINLDK